MASFDFKAEWAKVRADAIEYFKKLSLRERLLIAGVALIAIIILASSLYPPIVEAFEKQSEQLVKTRQEMDLVIESLARYSKLEKRRKDIEEAYREVEISEGILTYLETLIKNKAGVTSGIKINPRGDPRPFGDKFEQASFSVSFMIVDLQRLVQFLEELVYGEKPLILGRLDIKRRPAGDSLDVEMEVSSIRQKK